MTHTEQPSPLQTVSEAGSLRRPERRSIPAQVADLLIDAMLAGDYPPGTTLPPERELAERLGINRTSLRQAIARMEQVGLVESRQGVGTVACDPLRASDNGIVLRALAVAGPRIVDELLEVREPLAALAGRLAAIRSTMGDVAILDERLEAVRSARNSGALQAAELAFFSALVGATGNRPLQVMMRWFEELYGATAPFFLTAFFVPEEVVAGLVPIVEGVRNGDAGAAGKAATRYAHQSGERLLDAVRRGLGSQKPDGGPAAP